MVRLQILSGKNAGLKVDSRHLPMTVGRQAESDLALDEPGVWPAHCKIQFQPDGLLLAVEPDALASVNGSPVSTAFLRNGDVITLGGVNVRFTFSPVRQSNAAVIEWLTWIGLLGLCAGEVATILWLNR